MTKQDAMAQGAKYYCPKCGTAYVHVPKRWDDGVSCAGAWVVECRHCDCDMVLHLADDSRVIV